MNRLINLKLAPQGDLEQLGPDDAGRVRWRATGNDPRFACRFNTPLDGGWYGLDVDVEFSGEAAVAPVLYPDYGAGMHEGLRIELPFVQTAALAPLSVVRFVQAVQGLRFDPSAAPTELHLGAVRLYRLGRVRAGWRMARAVLGPTSSLVAKSRLVVNAAEQLFAGGTRRMADWLYEQYSTLGSDRQQSGEDTYEEWTRLYDNAPSPPGPQELRREPLISILLPVYNPPDKWLRKCLDSVLAQSYGKWELCIANDASTHQHVRATLDAYAQRDSRIKVVHRAVNGHISASSNESLALARGEFVALLDHDDELPPWALLEVARAINNNPEWKLIYTDEDKINESGRRFDPYFKPDWNYDLFLAQNCVSHLGVYQTEMVRSLGGFRVGMEGSQDWDLALRCVERLQRHQIGHIPRVLYHWRAIAGSTALCADEKGYAAEAGLRAVGDHLERVGCKTDAVESRGGQVSVRRRLPDRLPKVSLIIPTRDKVDLLRICVSSVLEKTDYQNFELLIVDNQSDERATLDYFDLIKSDPRVSVLSYDAPFNYSAINNYAAARASGEIIGLINNDIEVDTPEWLREMVVHALRDDVGAVGAMLLYPNGTIQHAGVILGMHGIAAHLYVGLPRDHAGQMGRAFVVQEMSAVTAACLLVRKAVFDEVGGLDEGLPVAFNDVDFCLRLREKGYRNVWTPNAVLYHHESASRGYEDTPEKAARFNSEVNFMRSRWNEFLARDPSYNCNLSLTGDAFSLAFPPR